MPSQISLSTGLKNYLLGGAGSLKTALAGGFIWIYMGDVPDDADDALTTQTLICKLGSENPPIDDTPATGLDLGTAASGAITKDADVWIGRVQGGAPVNGVPATFFRWCDSADTDPSLAATTSNYRVQGLVGASGSDMNFSPNNFEDNDTNTKSLNVFEVRIGA